VVIYHSKKCTRILEFRKSIEIFKGLPVRDVLKLSGNRGDFLRFVGGFEILYGFLRIWGNLLGIFFEVYEIFWSDTPSVIPFSYSSICMITWYNENY
jgi:hypothetical protein